MTALRLYNTASRSVEDFAPLHPPMVTMYNCGPTVYDFAHIGNLRTFILGDVLRRSLEWNRYKVIQVMNITDVDDKTIRRSQQEGVPLGALTHRYEDIFFRDLHALNILRPTRTPRATESISDMIALIEALLQKGCAYKGTDGIYFAIEKSPRYGALAQIDLSQATKERVANDEYDKEHPRDFALWKFAVPEDGEVVFAAPFGDGRPGWHIECSAMSMKALGETIDIHTGGTDLMFPHHTNEIAQSECATGKPFVRYWVHGAFIMVDGQKMSKSLGNITTMETLREHGVEALAFRYLVLGAHYRNLLNFTWDALDGATRALARLRNAFAALKDGDGRTNDEYRKRFELAINDDLGTPAALAVLWELLGDMSVSDSDKRATIAEFDRVLGLGLLDWKPSAIDIPGNIQKLADEREAAREAKDWAKSDELRAKLKTLGWEVKDTSDGPVLAPVKKQ